MDKIRWPMLIILRKSRNETINKKYTQISENNSKVCFLPFFTNILPSNRFHHYQYLEG